MLDFICMGFGELCGIQAKIQNENMSQAGFEQ